MSKALGSSPSATKSKSVFIMKLFFITQKRKGVCIDKMAQVEVPAGKPDNLSSVPGTCTG